MCHGKFLLQNQLSKFNIIYTYSCYAAGNMLFAIYKTIIWLAPRVGKMTQIARGDWLPERAKMEPSCPLGTTRYIPQEKFPRKPYNKSFIDQVCSVKMAGYWPRFFSFCEFMDLDFVHKKRAWPISSHLDLTLGQEPKYRTFRITAL